MATTQEQNERLTRVGPGTPMGNFLRRYWQVVGIVPELEREPVQPIRIFGEDLTLYRSESGTYGLLGNRCPHRCMAMEYGIPDQRGLRCNYHGWLFNEDGRCLEQPYEDRTRPEARYRDKVTIKAYPVQELGGLIFAYMGPQPAPLLPRWDLLVREDLDVVIDVHPLPCNWLQCMDNAADPVHFEWLHARYGNYRLKRAGQPPAFAEAEHVKIAFEPFKYGITKRRLLKGESEDSHDWNTGHPLIFPNGLAVMSATGEGATIQFRVPVDDTHTIQFGYRTVPHKPGEKKAKSLAVRRIELFTPDGKLIDKSSVATNVPPQDMLAWVAQGAISDRTEEHLASSDRGVIIYHKMLLDEMAKAERGEDPLGTIRDPAENEPMIKLRRENVGLTAFEVAYASYYNQIEELAEVRA